jgi:hypothetical protein
MTEYISNYYHACYEVRPAGEPIQEPAPCRVLMSNGQWLVPPNERPGLRESSNTGHAPKPSSDVYTVCRKPCEFCGREFVGPVNRRKCDCCESDRWKHGRRKLARATQRPLIDVFPMRRGQCEVCGGDFIGSPNRRLCDKHSYKVKVSGRSGRRHVQAG